MVKLGKRMVIGYYTSLLMYPSLGTDLDLDMMYGEVVISVSLKEL